MEVKQHKDVISKYVFIHPDTYMNLLEYLKFLLCRF